LQAASRSNGRETIKARGLDLASVARRVAEVYDDVIQR
jgi:hypothetical protein